MSTKATMRTNDTIKVGQKHDYSELGPQAVGTIQATPVQQERLEELTERLARGEFHKKITTNITIPVRCVDGRSLKEGVHPLAPNAAGGTESIFVADDLTTKRFSGDDNSTLSGYTNTIEMLQAAGYEVGGHTDTGAMGTASGCGANDRLPAIYHYMTEHDDTLRTVATQLGVEVPQSTHDLIIRNAAHRSAYSEGAALFAELCRAAHEPFVDYLDGSHNEVVAIINKRRGTTLDRAALKKEFGATYQAFNVDVWSFAEAARVSSLTPQEATQKVVAMVYYNVATTFVLGGPALRMIVLS